MKVIFQKKGLLFQDHSCILHSIIGWHSTVGFWTRVEGTPNDPNPNKPFAKLEIPSMFTEDGRLNPSITVIGEWVSGGDSVGDMHDPNPKT